MDVGLIGVIIDELFFLLLGIVMLIFNKYLTKGYMKIYNECQWMQLGPIKMNKIFVRFIIISFGLVLTVRGIFIFAKMMHF